jgi:hypothetical protein
MKTLIVIAFMGILGALGAAGFFMLRGKEGGSQSGQMMRALATRVALSIALFLFVIFAFWMGWITPTGIPVGR